jgi:hypothetical protein
MIEEELIRLKDCNCKLKKELILKNKSVNELQTIIRDNFLSNDKK